MFTSAGACSSASSINTGGGVSAPLPFWCHVKRFVASIALLCFFFFGSSDKAEANPGVIVLGAVAVGALALTLGAVSYYKPATTGSLAVPASANFYANPTTGGIGRMLVAQWNSQTAYLQDAVHNKLVAAKVAYSALVAAVTASPSTYPNLHGAIVSDGFLDSADMSSFTLAQAGAIASGTIARAWNGSYYTVGAFKQSETKYDATGTLYTGEKSIHYLSLSPPCVAFYVHRTGTNYYDGKVYYATPASAPSPQTSTPGQFVTTIAPGGIIPTTFQGEIDDYIMSGGSVSIVDSASPDTDETALFVAPIASPVAETSGLGSSTTTAAQTRLAGASTALAGAQTALSAAEAAYNNDPTPENLAALNTALAAVTDATTEKTAAQQAVNNATEAQEEKYPAPNPPPRKVLSWARWLQVFDAAEDLWIWGMMSDLSNFLQGMIREPVAPSFTYTDNHQNSVTVSLSSLDSIALFVRWFIGIISTIGIVMMVARWWRGN